MLKQRIKTVNEMLNLGELLSVVNKECVIHEEYLLKLFQEHVDLIQCKLKELNITKIDIIGSLAHNTFLPGSDLDINCYSPLGVLFVNDSQFWRNYGENLIVGPITERYGKKRIDKHLIMKGTVLLVTIKHPDGLKIDYTVNNNKCMRNANFYSIFGQLDVYKNTVRILKLFSKRNVGRRRTGNNILVYPGGFFYDMLVAQIIVDQNEGVVIESAFVDINIDKIRDCLKVNGYDTTQCLKDCLAYILSLQREKKLVFDYEECQYNYWSFVSKEVREEYQQKLEALDKIVKKGVYPIRAFLPQASYVTLNIQRRKNRKKHV